MLTMAEARGSATLVASSRPPIPTSSTATSTPLRRALGGVDVGAPRTLPVRPRHEEGRKGPLRMAHLGHEGPDRLQPELDPEARAGGEVGSGQQAPGARHRGSGGYRKNQIGRAHV